MRIFIALSILFPFYGYSQVYSPDSLYSREDPPNDCYYLSKNFSFQSLPLTLHEKTTGWVLNPETSEEFNGYILNSSNWEVGDNLCHAMSPDAYFRDNSDNIYVNNGSLKLKVTGVNPVECTYEDENKHLITRSYEYASGWIQSVRNIHYGYIEMRCYLPNDNSLYPCFWMVGGIWQGQNLIGYDEIDVFERKLYSIDVARLLQNFYHDTGLSSWNKLSHSLQYPQNCLGNYYVFAVEWLPEEINFIINGDVTSSIRYTDNHNLFQNEGSSYFACTDFLYAIPQKLQVSLSFRRFTPDPNIGLPYEVDYIRCYKLMKSNISGTYAPNAYNYSDPEMFRVHNDILLGGDGRIFTIPGSNTDVTFWGENSVILDAGFTLHSYAEFAARTIKTDNDLFPSSGSSE